MKDRVASIQERLRQISVVGNKNHQLTLTRFFQERFLYRLSKSGYKNHFVLKGGVLIYALEGETSRPTLDLDLLAKKVAADKEKVKAIFWDICSIAHESDGVCFDSESIETTDINKEGNYSGIRVKVEVSLGKIKQRMQVDIGFGDIIIPKAIPMTFPTLMGMEQPELLAYTVESLIAEKFEAMIDLADLNSRMKDFYDVYCLLKKGGYNEQTLQKAISSTFARRGTAFSPNHILFTEGFYMDSKRNDQWVAFLRKSSLDESLLFQEVMGYVREKLKPVYEGMK